MKKVLMWAMVLSYSLVASEFLCSYKAKLSGRDHFNSKGQRIKKAYGVLLQDRANYYRFRRRDKADRKDCFFKTQKTRKLLKHMFKRGKISPSIQKEIVNSTPTVKVKIYSDYLKVKILKKGGKKKYKKKKRVSHKEIPVIEVDDAVRGTASTRSTSIDY